MIDLLVGGILVTCVSLAIAYMVKAKKSGVKCIGCSSGGCCSGGCSSEGGCGSCGGHTK